MNTLPPLCRDPGCLRHSIHWVGEYGCAASKVWICRDGNMDRGCPQRYDGAHRPGCGCPGDPKQGRADA